ncbi:MAG: EF-P lysine aminoacylase GenX [Gammaproteobacteria bacterium]|jgi:lysyl-tRNA synthetase class 2|nr:EF-P lysine aminoacylase GenX [Gammaproteobacteria bacterium]
MQTESDWRPLASLDVLKLRASILARIREFFTKLDVLEVDTPVLSRAATTDPALCSFKTVYSGPGAAKDEPRYLHTSPEFPMKRLLAAGSGSIYQICKVFRNGESGIRHNPEFMLLEWYRTGFDELELMEEVQRLVTDVLTDVMPIDTIQHWCYRDLFVEMAAVDPFTATVAELSGLLQSRYGVTAVGLASDDRDAWLDLLMTHVIEPRLGNGLVFIRDYPASQAALARVRPGDPPVAARFEVYLNGIEIANGFHELADAEEQQRRFERELQQRCKAGSEVVTMDEKLLSALRSGLPDCAGVALGLDRLLMLASGSRQVQDVLAFPFHMA